MKTIRLREVCYLNFLNSIKESKIDYIIVTFHLHIRLQHKSMESFLQNIRTKKLFIVFTWGTRILLAIGFLPSGLKKAMGERFTLLGIDSPVGFFFEALYRTGFYWNFIGIAQLLAALLLIIPRTKTLGAIL